MPAVASAAALAATAPEFTENRTTAPGTGSPQPVRTCAVTGRGRSVPAWPSCPSPPAGTSTGVEARAPIASCTVAAPASRAQPAGSNPTPPASAKAAEKSISGSAGFPFRLIQRAVTR